MIKCRPAVVAAILAVIAAISGATVSVHVADTFGHNGTHTIE